MNLTDDDRLVILDFENHPRANLWVDHHWNQSVGGSRVINQKVRYDLSAKSAARIIGKSGQFYYDGKYDASFLDMVDIIDSADYSNIHEIFNNKHPLMLIRAYLEMAFPSKMMICRIVEVMRDCKFDMNKVVYRLNIGVDVLDELKSAARKAKKNMVVCKSCSILRMKNQGQYPRYSEFYINGSLKYSIRITGISNKRVYIQVGFNKWSGKYNETNIGQLLSSIDYLIKGGGHHDVGGAIAEEDDVESFLDLITDKLNNERDTEMEEMEKYGVAKEDPVEATAESMVKTGEAKTIDDARKKAAEVETSKKKTDEDPKNG
jgi:hypothetical protein